jgi:hypothetical protein
MNKVVGNALLYSTGQPVICFTERAQGTDPAGTEQDGVVEHEDREDRRKYSTRKPAVWSVERSWEDMCVV